MGNIASKKQLFMDACKHNNLEKVKNILFATNKDNIYRNDETILLYVCINCNVDILDFLIDYGTKKYCNTNIIVKGIGQIYFKCIISSNNIKFNIDIVKYLLRYSIRNNLCICNDNMLLRCIMYKCLSCDRDIFCESKIHKSDEDIGVLLKLFLEYRYNIKQPFDIAKYEDKIYDYISYATCKRIIFVLFEYGEKINYKLNIHNIYPDCYNYFRYLIKHNYKVSNKIISYNKTNNYKNMNGYLLMKLFGIYKKMLLDQINQLTRILILVYVYSIIMTLLV